MSLYRIGRKLFHWHFRFYYRYKVIDAHHVPQEGPVILCSNHISNWDPPLIGVSCPRQVCFMAKEELFKIPVLGFLIKRLGAYPVRRGAGDRAAIRKTLEILGQNKVIVIFPEGHRSKTGELGEGKTGAALFALKSEAQVVPMAIIGSYKWFRPLEVRFGEPIPLEEYRKQKITSQLLQELTDLIMERIDSLRKGRGVS
jgi:1-acyl-sn-glycerol-3-phosphate acyltransferase